MSSVTDLTLPQAAYLVGLLKSPTYLVENPKAAEERAAAVLNAMVANGRLSNAQRYGLVPEKPRPDKARYLPVATMPIITMDCELI